MKNESLNLETKRPAKWTWLELTGLTVALFLIVWPILSLAYGLFFPNNAKAQSITSFTANNATPAPGSSYSYITTIDIPVAGQVFNFLQVTIPTGITFNSATCQTGCSLVGGGSLTGPSTVNFDSSGNPSVGPTTITLVVNVSVPIGMTSGTPLNASARGRVDTTIMGPIAFNHSVGNSTGTTAPGTTATTVAPSTPPVTTAPPTTAATTPPTTAATTPPTTAATTPPTTAATTPPTTTATTPPTTAATTPPTTAATTPPLTIIVPTATTVAPTVTGGTPGTATASATATATATPTGTTNSLTATATATATPTGTPTPTLPNGAIPVQTDVVTVSSLPTRAGAQGATATPTIASATTVAQGQPTATSTATPPQLADGVISGRFSGGSLGGVRVELVRRGATTTNIPSALDNNGQYSFLGVRPTSSGEVYFIRFSNPNGGTLRSWESNSFTFSGGRLDMPTIDVSDVGLGAPGSSNTVFQLPLTLNWSTRNGEDAYQVTVSRSDGSGVAFRSNSLGNANSFTLQAGSLQPGEYFATINVSNGNGSGSSSRQFQFRIGSGNFIPVNPTTAPPPAQTTAAQPPARTTTVAAVQPTTARPPVATTAAPAQTTAVAQATTAARTTEAATSAPAVSPTVVIGGQDPAQVGQGSGNATPGRNSGTGSSSNPGTSSGSSTGSDSGSLPGGTQELPRSGGEMPLLGLLLAALTLGFRRIRLVAQKRVVS